MVKWSNGQMVKWSLAALTYASSRVRERSLSLSPFLERESPSLSLSPERERDKDRERERLLLLLLLQDVVRLPRRLGRCLCPPRRLVRPAPPCRPAPAITTLTPPPPHDTHARQPVRAIRIRVTSRHFGSEPDRRALLSSLGAGRHDARTRHSLARVTRAFAPRPPRRCPPPPPRLRPPPRAPCPPAPARLCPPRRVRATSPAPPRREPRPRPSPAPALNHK